MQGIGIGSINGTWDRYEGPRQVYKIAGRQAGRIEVLISCCVAVAHRPDGRWQKQVKMSPAEARAWVEEMAA